MADYTLIIKAVDQTSGAFKNIQNGLNGISKGADEAEKVVSSLFQRIAAFAGAKKIIDLADSFLVLQNKLRAASASNEEAATRFEAVGKIAAATRSDISDIGQLYVRIASSADLLKISQGDVARITETFAKSLKVGGASAQEASAATRQFAQALGSGVLRGDEFNSIFEASPTTMAALAKALGIPIDQMRKFAEQGRLTADVVAKGFLKMSADVDVAFGKTTPTIKEAFTQIQNAGVVALGQLESKFGIFSGLAATLQFVANNLTILATGFIIAFGPQIIGLIGATATALKALSLSNPFTAIALAATLLIAYIADLKEKTGSWGNAFKTVGNAAIEAVNFVINAFAALPAFFGPLFDGIKSAFKTALNPFSEGSALEELQKGLVAGLNAAKQKVNSEGPIKFRFQLDEAALKAAQDKMKQATAGGIDGKINIPSAGLIKAKKEIEDLDTNIDASKIKLQLLLDKFKTASDYATRIKYAQEIDSLRKSLGEASPPVLSFTDDMRKFGAQLVTTAGQQERAQAIATVYAKGVLDGTGSLESFRQSLQGVNDLQASNEILKAKAILALSDENKQLDISKIKLDVVSDAYSKGTASIEQYLAVLASIPASQKTADNYLAESAGKYSLQETVIGRQIDVLKTLRQQYADGTISLQEYTARTSDLSDAITRTGRGIADVLGGAEQQAKANRNNITLQGELNKRLAEGKIKFDEYRLAAQDIGISQEVADRNINSIGSIETKFAMFSDNVKKYSEEAGTKFSDSFVDAILTGKNALNSFRDFFGDLLKYIAAQILKANIADPLAKALSGAVGGLFGGTSGGAGSNLFGSIGKALGSIFGGFFADGGNIPANKVSVVGERGPELFVPGSSGSIVPNEAMRGQGDNIHVNFAISAIDTQSGVEFLVKNKQILTQVIEQAYNKKGRRGPVTA